MSSRRSPAGPDHVLHQRQAARRQGTEVLLAVCRPHDALPLLPKPFPFRQPYDYFLSATATATAPLPALVREAVACVNPGLRVRRGIVAQSGGW